MLIYNKVSKNPWINAVCNSRSEYQGWPKGVMGIVNPVKQKDKPYSVFSLWDHPLAVFLLFSSEEQEAHVY